MNDFSQCRYPPISTAALDAFTSYRTFYFRFLLCMLRTTSPHAIQRRHTRAIETSRTSIHYSCTLSLNMLKEMTLANPCQSMNFPTILLTFHPACLPACLPVISYLCSRARGGGGQENKKWCSGHASRRVGLIGSFSF